MFVTESLIAHWADKSLDAHVRDNVSCKVAFEFKCIVAVIILTRKWALTRMSSYVIKKVAKVSPDVAAVLIVGFMGAEKDALVHC